MSKIRINELARQLEVKSREVIDKLHELGIAEKVTHSSSIDDDMADKLRRYYAGDGSVRVRTPRNLSGDEEDFEKAHDEHEDRESGGPLLRVGNPPPAPQSSPPRGLPRTAPPPPCAPPDT